MSEGFTVLYAEDDSNDVFFMRRAFAKLKSGATLHTVTNGSEAIDYLSAAGAACGENAPRAPDLLILDIKMPLISGLEVLSWVRAQPQFAALPVVMFTSSTQESDVVESRLHGANAYLVKPSNAGALAPLMEKVLQLCAQKTSVPARLPLESNQL